MAVRAVIFDCFGVLVTDGWFPFLHQHFHDEPDKREQAVTANRMVDAGIKDYDVHVSELALLANIKPHEVRRQIENNVQNAELFNFIRDELKTHYKIGLLSNAGDNWLDRLFEPWQQELLDEVVLSCDIGVTKPHEMMYTTIAAKLGVLPEECVFIDDIARYCHGAEDAGMHAILYENPEKTISAIRELL